MTEQADRAAAYAAFDAVASPNLEGRDYSFYRLWFRTGYEAGLAAGRAESTALLDAADTLCQLHFVEPGTVTAATVQEAAERLAALVAEARSEAVAS